MYTKKRIFRKEGNKDNYNPFSDGLAIHHSPSYYMRGGIDLNRKERNPVQSVPTEKEDIADGVVDIFADPRVSKFDILETAAHISTARRKKVEEIEF